MVMGPHFGDHRGQRRGAEGGANRGAGVARERGWVGKRDKGKGTLCQVVAVEASYLLNPHLNPLWQEALLFPLCRWGKEGSEKRRSRLLYFGLSSPPLPVLEAAPPSTWFLLPQLHPMGPPCCSMVLTPSTIGLGQ